MPKLAIVEDDHSIAYMYELKFKSAGYDVTVSSDGAEGLATIEKQKPDLILLDLKMPVMSGDEMLEKLRNTPWGRDIKVIILTNISRDEAPHTIRHLGISHYIVKSNHTPKDILELADKTLLE